MIHITQGRDSNKLLFTQKLTLSLSFSADISTLSARFFRVLDDPYAYGVFNITQYSRFMMTINNKTYEKIRSSM
ncbi:hypothetical protein UB33_14925 [Photobacterium angustum]|nr:hypothetical protein UB39_04610 [Photobacterium angustum]KJG05220.1 hypothetical protein UB33_14925 [Photobacterium angustum]PSV93035.1 hypothetical protein CTN01_11025 [Photobacterium angustum]PSW79502.1 hypothetical protein CTN03_14915 [Photobacterium angustum]